MKIKQKKQVTSVRLSYLEKNQVKRIFNMNIGQFIRACLKISNENNYIKNKIKKEGEK
jgi:hypothetical protein